MYQPEALTAPCRMDRFSFGITSAGSTFIKVPSPVHFGQAPWGLLKENIRGSSSPTETPWSGQA